MIASRRDPTFGAVPGWRTAVDRQHAALQPDYPAIAVSMEAITSTYQHLAEWIGARSFPERALSRLALVLLETRMNEVKDVFTCKRLDQQEIDLKFVLRLVGGWHRRKEGMFLVPQGVVHSP
jgi:hypothetical protein